MAFLSFDDGGATVINYLIRSEEFDNAAWTKNTGCTVTPNIATAPDGLNTGDTIAYDGSGSAGDFRIYQTAAAPLNPVALGTAFTLSLWLKAPAPVTVRIGNNNGTFTTCVVTTTWQRFSVSAIGDGVHSAQLLLYSPAGVNTPFTLYAWGAQAEIGSYATAYIHTTAAVVGAVSLQNDYPGTPASRFGNWTPITRPFGDSTNTLGAGALVMVRYRTDFGASFELTGIPVKAGADSVNYAAIADRLIAHLTSGGTVNVQTGDSDARVYPTCGLWPGTTPTLQLSDRRNLLYTLSLQLINLAASPVRMDAVYR